jgi:hypothetical protein
VTKTRLALGETTQLKVRVSVSDWTGGCNGGDSRAEKVIFLANEASVGEVQVPKGGCFEYQDVVLDWSPTLTPEERRAMTEKLFSTSARVIPSRVDDPVLALDVTVVVPN